MFSTQVKISESLDKIQYEHSLMALGSCFAENIGNVLRNNFFSVNVNPFGVLYNPFSIGNSLEYLIRGECFSENDLFYSRSMWNSFAHSTLFSSCNQVECLQKINKSFENACRELRSCNFLIITFGTSWVYELKSTGRLVSNCHKLPASEFNRRRLTVAEIVEQYVSLIERIRLLNPGVKIIFTVSPVRHWKDGAHENNLSKSVLHLAIDEIQQLFSCVSYFPAYEIVMDELRDYRYYAEDMLHPSDVAVKYIWSKFAQVYFDDLTRKIMSELEQLNRDLNHRPLLPDTPEYQQFLQKRQTKLDAALAKYPWLNERLLNVK